MGENDEEEEEEQEDTLLGLGGHNSEASDEDASVGGEVDFLSRPALLVAADRLGLR